jgi:hypothetical protein
MNSLKESNRLQKKNIIHSFAPFDQDTLGLKILKYNQLLRLQIIQPKNNQPTNNIKRLAEQYTVAS